MRSISPEFIWALYCAGARRSLLRKLIRESDSLRFFEAVRKNELTPEQAAELMMIGRESNYWIVRFYKNYLQGI